MDIKNRARSIWKIIREKCKPAARFLGFCLDKIQFTGIGTILATVLVTIIVECAVTAAYSGKKFPLDDWGHALIGSGTAVLCLIIIRLATIKALFLLGWRVYKLQGLALPPGRNEVINFLIYNMVSLQDNLRQVLSHQGALMNQDDIKYFTLICFKEGRGAYTGIDSTLPHEFDRLYPDFLEYHAMNVKSHPKDPKYRILVASRTQIRQDYQKDPTCFYKFFNWHKERQVELLYVNPGQAKSKIKELNLPTTDIGTWKDNYALLFTPQKDSAAVNLIMVANGSLLFEKCEDYFKSMYQIAAPISAPPKLVDEDLAEHWETYINVDERRKMLEPFLLEVLNKYKDDEILDAAAGIGCESVLLKQNHFKIRANEVEDSFRKVAKVYANKHSVKFLVDDFDWLNIYGENQYEANRFGAVLVLGNSLCLLTKHNDRVNAIRNFWEIIKPGGIIIIDERNFRYMMTNRDNIMKNPVKNFKFGGVMYCGGAVKGCPIEINDDKITWACYRLEYEDAATESPILDNKSIIGEFELYPFKENEISSLLKEQGFIDIKMYSDFKKSFDSNAEFYTYTAIKPQ